MPNVYPSGATLPESRSTVRGGLAVVLHNPVEIDGLIALCLFSPRPPSNPIASVYRALGDSSLDLAAWAEHQRDLEVLRPSVPINAKPAIPAESAQTNVRFADELLPTGQLGKLLFALQMAKELWQAQKEEAALLSLVVLLADPSNPGPGELHLDGDAGIFVIRPGSIAAEVVRLPLPISSWAVGLMLGGGTTTGARRSEMVRRLREKAIGDPLMDIRELASHPPSAEKCSPRLAVLVHGLFATDKGTFKGLQARLENHFQVVGFPHDTLSQSIEANGFELAQYLGKLDYMQVCFVAHSRGGLVVRSAVDQLNRRTGGNYLPNARCATFGTPHLGAEMAENPGLLIAAIAFAKAGVIDRSVASVVDMLVCVAEQGGFPGIRDLRPASTEDTWLAKLQAKEKLYPDILMPFFVVGGDRRPAGLMQRAAGFLAARMIGRQPNDLIVAQSSSLPLLSSDNQSRHQAVACDHFGYFEEDQAATHDQVVEFLCKPTINLLPTAPSSPPTRMSGSAGAFVSDASAAGTDAGSSSVTPTNAGGGTASRLLKY